MSKQPDYLYRLISLHTAPRHLRSSNYTVLTEPSFTVKNLGSVATMFAQESFGINSLYLSKTLLHQRPPSNIN